MPEANWREKMIAQERRQLAASHRIAQIWGAFAALLACAMLGRSLLSGGPQGEVAFYLGQLTGWILGVLLFIVGLYYVFRKRIEPTLTPEPIDPKDLEPLEVVRNRPAPPGVPMIFLKTCVKPWLLLVASGLLLGIVGAYCSIDSGGSVFPAMLLVGIVLCSIGLIAKTSAGR